MGRLPALLANIKLAWKKHSRLFARSVSDEEEKFNTMETRCQFNKDFTAVANDDCFRFEIK